MDKKPNIRGIQLEDRPALIGLVSMMIGDSNKDEVSNYIVDDFYNNKLFTTYVIASDDEVASYISYKREPFEGSNQVGEIVFLGTKEEHRKHGYGQALVEYIETYSRENGIRKLYVKTSPTNTRAVCFWIKNGYQFEARMKDFSCENVDAYFMGKSLK